MQFFWSLVYIVLLVPSSDDLQEPEFQAGARQCPGQQHGGDAGGAWRAGWRVLGGGGGAHGGDTRRGGGGRRGDTVLWRPGRPSVRLSGHCPNGDHRPRSIHDLHTNTDSTGKTKALRMLNFNYTSGYLHFHIFPGPMLWTCLATAWFLLRWVYDVAVKFILNFAFLFLTGFTNSF